MDKNAFHEGWYVIYTRPRHERKVNDQLTVLSLQSFLPTHKMLRQWHDRRKVIEEPLFPSYVFIYLQSMEQYYRSIHIEGALYYVKTGNKIARVHETVISNLQLIKEQTFEMEVCEQYFQPGQKLLISEGAMTGLVCEVVQFKNSQRLLVRIDLLQRNLLLTLPTSHLIAI